MRVNLKRIIPLLAIIGLMAGNENVQHRHYCEIIENDKLIYHGFYQFINTSNINKIIEHF